MDFDRGYKTFCGTLCDIMDKDWGKQEDKFAASWPFLNHIPPIAWKPMVSIAVEKWDGWPKNWAKCVKEVYELWRGGSHHSTVKYERDYDDRFPVELMRVAYSILVEKGDREFLRYCDAEHMPVSDRERIVMKNKVVKGEVRINTNDIKNKIGIACGHRPITVTPERMAQLQAQKEVILRQPGEDAEELLF